MELPGRAACGEPQKHIADGRDDECDARQKVMSAVQKHDGNIKKEENEWRTGEEVVGVRKCRCEPCGKNGDGYAEAKPGAEVVALAACEACEANGTGD